MSLRVIMKVDGISGESQLEKGWIDVHSFSWGASNDIKASENQHTGVAHVHDFSVTKAFDHSSPDLMTACVNGKALSKVEVKLMHSSGSEKPKMLASYTFNTCFITHVGTSGSEGGAAGEQLSFNFAKAEYGYGSHKGGFDVGKGGIKGQ